MAKFLSINLYVSKRIELELRTYSYRFIFIVQLYAITYELNRTLGQSNDFYFSITLFVISII
jgi:hypothetical protein